MAETNDLAVQAVQSAQATKIKGKDLMLFITNNGVTKALALVTNTTLSITANTNEYKTKDDTSESNPEITSVSWEATSESMYAVEAGQDAQITANEVIKAMLAKTLIGVAIAETSQSGKDVSVPTGGWKQKDASFTMSGNGYITSFQLTASNEDYATVSITITGKGPLNTLA